MGGGSLVQGRDNADYSNFETSTQRCSVASGLNGKVLSVSDGTNERCIAVVAPASANGPLPILFWFHGSGGSAASCGDDHGNAELGQLAIDNGNLGCGRSPKSLPIHLEHLVEIRTASRLGISRMQSQNWEEKTQGCQNSIPLESSHLDAA